MSANPVFENYVNYAGSKTVRLHSTVIKVFENYVNYAGSKTRLKSSMMRLWFENYVNYAGSKTLNFICNITFGLRTM